MTFLRISDMSEEMHEQLISQFERSRVFRLIKWVSVKDRLPEKSGRYLGVYKSMGDGDVVALDYEFSTQGRGSWWMDGGGGTPDRNLTHWAEVPALPREE